MPQQSITGLKTDGVLNIRRVIVKEQHVLSCDSQRRIDFTAPKQLDRKQAQQQPPQTPHQSSRLAV